MATEGGTPLAKLRLILDSGENFLSLASLSGLLVL